MACEPPMSKERAQRRAERERESGGQGGRPRPSKERRARSAARKKALTGWLPRVNLMPGTLAARRRREVAVTIAILVALNLLVWIVRPDWQARLGALVVSVLVVPVLLLFVRSPDGELRLRYRRVAPPVVPEAQLDGVGGATRPEMGEGVPASYLELLPAVDIADGQAVQLVQGVAGSEKRFGDPVAAALRWQEAGAEWIHLVDLDAAFGRGHNRDLQAEIVGRLDIDVEMSGGIRDDESLAAAMATGCRRVNIGTAALETPEWCAQRHRDVGRPGRRRSRRPGKDPGGARLDPRGRRPLRRTRPPR